MSNLLRNRTAAARELFARGLDHEQIGEALGLSPVTIRKYVDDDFRREIEAHNAKLRAAEKAKRAKAKAERDAAVRALFIKEANDCCCLIPVGEFDEVFALWKKRRSRK